MSAPAGKADVLEREIAPALPSIGGGTIDVQIVTAKKFPRSLTLFHRRATEMATLTPEIAASCVYAVPRDGKTIEGPSARLAEIVAHAWGNLRIQAGVSDQDDRFVTARGEAWDVEANVAIGFEVRRRITNRHGATFSDDMITTTGNAAASIALRNAVLKTVPTSFWKPIYLKCREVIAGKAETFAVRRDEMLKAFAVMGATEQRVCKALGLNGKGDITIDHMVTLTGFYNALKDGETSLEEAFPDGGGLGTPQPAKRKSETAQPAAQNAGAPADTGTATSTPAAPATSIAPASPIGKIAMIHPRPNGAVLELETGFTASTRDLALLEAAKKHHAAGTVIELSTRPSSDPAKYAPTLEEISVTPAATERQPGEEG